jgi:hypothetical protein
MVEGRSHLSPNEPTPTVDVEFHQSFITHFQQEGLACLLIWDIGTLHNLKKLKGFSRSASKVFCLLFSMPSCPARFLTPKQTVL